MNLNQTVWLEFDYMNEHYEAEAIPALTQQNSCVTPAFDIYFDNEYSGTILKDSNYFASGIYLDNGLLKIIRNKLCAFFNDWMQVV